LTFPAKCGPNTSGPLFVRFNHGWEPAGFQMYRAFRRLLLRQFNV
jgi:hypothetical protein